MFVPSTAGLLVAPLPTAGIQFTDLDTVSAMASWPDAAALVFASGLNPGGGYRVGARGQEEDVCRAHSHLIDYLEGDACRLFYEEGRRTAPVFSDSCLLVERFIFAAAPDCRDRLAEDHRALLSRRACRVAQVARSHGWKQLVVGAWGCGAYRNNVLDVVDAWRDVVAQRLISLVVAVPNKQILDVFRRRLVTR